MGPFIPWPSGTTHGNVTNTGAGHAGGASPLLGKHPPLCLPDSVDAFRQAGQRTYSLHSLAFEEKMLQCRGSSCLSNSSKHSHLLVIQCIYDEKDPGGTLWIKGKMAHVS